MTRTPLRAALASFAVALVLPLVAHAQTEAETKCQAAKLKTTGKYAACRLVAEASAVKSGELPDYSNCDEKLSTSWAKIEAAAEGGCASTGDLETVRSGIDSCIPTTRYVVFLAVTNVTTIGSFQFDVSYSEASGSFEGSGNMVSCQSLVPGALYAHDDIDAEETLRLGFVAFEEFNGPVDVARCIFISTGVAPPNDGQFHVTEMDANRANGDPAVPTPQIGYSIFPE